MAERRQVPRYLFEATGRLYSGRGGAGLNVSILVISTRGCMLHGGEVASGKKCELVIPWRGKEITVEAKVVWKDMQGQAGLKFSELSQDDRRQLEDLCATLRIQASSTPAHIDSPPSRNLWGAEPTRPAPSAASRPRPASESKKAQKHERRRVPRYVSQLASQLLPEGSGSTSTVSVVTLSILGGLLEGEELPGPAKKCLLTLDWGGKELKAETEVVWKKNRQCGFKFLSLSEAAKNHLKQICSNLRLQPLAPIPSEGA